MQKICKNRGFTLAEVLVTIVIIGVVAAMTLSSLITSYQKQTTVAKLERTYSLIQQAVRKAETDYEEMRFWNFDLSDVEFMRMYIKPYYSVLQEYEPRQLVYTTYQPDGTQKNDFFDYRTLPRIVLNDGVMLSFQKKSNALSYSIVVDLNAENPPNRYGRDLFAFSVQKDGKLTPYGLGIFDGGKNDSLDRDYFISPPDGYRGCNKNSNGGGVFCAALIMLDGWKIKDDYPW